MFVPGGQSQGGVLPQNMADGRWRGEGQGEDRFVSVLRLAQQEGASEAKDRDKTRHFELKDDAMIKQVVIDGPFLGEAAAEAEDPPAADPPQPDARLRRGTRRRRLAACRRRPRQRSAPADGSRRRPTCVADPRGTR